MGAVAGYGRRRTDDARAWAEEARGRSAVVARAFDVAERDRAHLGGLLAGAVAFRLFLWILPLSLLLVGALGALTTMDDSAVADASDDVGLGGALSEAVAEGAGQRGWWIALVAGLLGTVYAGAGAVRALRIGQAAAWGIPPPRLRHPLRASLTLTAIGVGVIAVSVAAGWLRERSATGGLAATIAMAALYFVLWLRVSAHMPRAATSVRALVPGAVLVAAGAEALHLFTTYVLAPGAERAVSVYGAIGAALTLLLWLFIVARLLVGSAILNAELWARRDRGAATGRAR